MSVHDSLRQPWQSYNRVYLGQIDGINATNGTVSVVIFDGLDIKRDNLELPHGGFSQNGQKSSWMRYMPQCRKGTSDTDSAGGDLVYVAFGPRNEARIVGYATYPGTYQNYKDSTSSAIPYGDFVKLEQGEWDFRSSGGAYVHGSKFGSLLLSAGPLVQVRLDKQNSEIRTEAPLWRIGGSGSFLKIGDVKRTIPTSPFKESNVSLIDPTAQKEFNVHLENFGAVSTLIADEQLGAIRNDLGTPYFSQVVHISPLRYRRKIWDVGSTSLVKTAAYSNEIDSLGNQVIDFGLKATEVNVNCGPLQDANLNALNTSVSTTSSTEVKAGTSVTLEAGTNFTASATLNAEITAGLQALISASGLLLTGGGVKLGSSLANEQLLKGSTYIRTMSPIWTAMTEFFINAAVVLPDILTKTGVLPLSATSTNAEDMMKAVTSLNILLPVFSAMLFPPAPVLLSQKVATE